MKEVELDEDFIEEFENGDKLLELEITAHGFSC